MRNFILFSLVSVFIIACNKEPATNANQKVLYTDLGGSLGNLDPQGAFDQYTFRVLSDLYEGIISMDQANNPIPGLAESWTVSNDGLVYDFYLRHNLKFSNGSPIKASDFVYSWRRMIDPKTGGYGGSSFNNIVNATDIIGGKAKIDSLGVEAVNDYQFRVSLSKPDPAFIDKCTAIFTTPLSSVVIGKYGESWTNVHNIVTSGPYRLVSSIVNGQVALEKNPNYFEANKIAVESVVFTPYVDRNAALAAYKTGAIDILNGVPIDQYARLKNDYPQELKTVTYEGITFYSLNVLNPKLNNSTVRKALSLAINRETLARQILANGQIPLYSYVTPTVEHGRYSNLNYAWMNWSQVQRESEARKLLKEASLDDSQLVLDITYDNNDLSKKTALAVASMWQKVLGIKVNLIATDWATYLDKRKNSDFEVLRNSWGAAFNHVTTYTPEYACMSNVNVSRLCTVNYDELIADANQELVYDRQTKFYDQALLLAMDEYAIIPLFQNSYTMMISPHIHGLQVESNLLHDIRSKWITKG